MRAILLVLIFMLSRYVIWGVFGSWESSEWLIFYHFTLFFLLEGILVNELRKPIPLYIKYLCLGLMLVILFHFLRVCSNYEPDYFEFIDKFDRDSPVWWFSKAYIIIAIPLVLFKNKVIVFHKFLIKIKNNVYSWVKAKLIHLYTKHKKVISYLKKAFVTIILLGLVYGMVKTLYQLINLS